MAPRTPAAAAGRPVDLPRVLSFMRLLWALNHGLVRVSKDMDRRLGVTGLQRLAVRIVGRSPGISAGALARALHVDPSTLTGVLAKLTTRGVLRRTADPRDGRRALFALTPGGARVDRLRAGTVEDRVRRALLGVSDEDMQATTRVLSRIVAALATDEADS